MASPTATTAPRIRYGLAWPRFAGATTRSGAAGAGLGSDTARLLVIDAIAPRHSFPRPAESFAHLPKDESIFTRRATLAHTRHLDQRTSDAASSRAAHPLALSMREAPSCARTKTTGALARRFARELSRNLARARFGSCGCVRYGGGLRCPR